MGELKTRPTDASVDAFIAAVEPATRREDCRTVAAMMERVTGFSPVMWGSSIVGFGAYTYVNTTKKPADWPITGFSPRKTSLTLYIMPGFDGHDGLMARLGKHTTGASCLYLKKLADIDIEVLEELISESVAHMRERYPTRQ